MKEAPSIFEQTRCLSQQQLLDYVEGKLPEEQIHRVESHIAGCVMCSDALEGLQQMPRTADIPQMVKQIHHEVHRELRRRRGKERPVRTYLWYSTLIAIILLILLIAFFTLYFVQRRERAAPAAGPASTAWVQAQWPQSPASVSRLSTSGRSFLVHQQDHRAL
jgi:anti-sigma factor RsiW